MTDTQTLQNKLIVYNHVARIDRLNLKVLCDVIDFSNYTIYICIVFPGYGKALEASTSLGKGGIVGWRDGRWPGGGVWRRKGVAWRRQLEVAQGGWQRFRADGKAYLVESGRR